MDELSIRLSGLLRLLADQGRSPRLLSDLGATYFSLGDLGQALCCLDESASLDPDDGRTHYNRALVLAASARTLEAIDAYRRALQLVPAEAPLAHSCRWNLSKLLLACGAYPEAWALYEARRLKPQPLPLICHPGCESWQPLRPVAGRLILIAEQGLGDVLQFLRFIPSLQAFASALLVVVPASLVSLLRVQPIGIHVCSPDDYQPQPADRFWPLLSTPSLFGLGPEGAVWHPPYLQAPPQRLDVWRPRLLRSRQLLVALNWQGNPLTEIQELKGRSLPLELLAPLAQIPAVELLALQHGAGLEQLSACSFRNRFHPEQDAVSQAPDFRDTAAILACCDLLISSDTALVHLAGALGVSTWVLLHSTPDWRWGLTGGSSNWYPTLRLFRQEQPADWPSLIERVQTALEQFCSEPPEHSPALPRLTPMTFVDGWQQDVQALWDRDQRHEAIQLLLSRINGCLPDRPLIASKQFSLYLFLLGQYQASDQVLLELRRRCPDDLELLETQAVVRCRLGRYQEAVEGYEAFLRLSPGVSSVNVWDGLANARSKLGQYSEAVHAGEQSLRLKDAETRALPDWQLPAGLPQAWLKGHPGASVIAFSLWGANPRYLRGLLRNLLLIPELYPSWTARVYLDRSVPQEFRALAESLGAELCLQPDAVTLRERLCWRFQVANDATVGRFLVRDTDSVVNQREARAVQQWIESDRWFHVMRDWWTHTDLVLAGMWGGVAGVLPDLMELLRSYTPAARETPNVDQWFLRDCVWDSIRRSVLSHDRCYRTLDSQPWPDPDPDGDQHVGQDEFSARLTQQRDWLWPWIQAYPCLQLQDELRVSAPFGVSAGSRKLNIDLRTCRTVFISMERDSSSASRMTQMLSLHGFRDVSWSPGVRVEPGHQLSRERAHSIGVALAHRRALLDAAGEQPLLVLEDDVEIDPDGLPVFDVPADSDAVWVGISRYGKPVIQPFSKSLSRVSRMFSSHAILYLSSRYQRHVVGSIDQCIECNLPFDVALAFYQKDFSVFALNHALFYQASAGGGAHDFEAFTKGAIS
jgi:tetratricopeptide (TPR) repeat protein